MYSPTHNQNQISTEEAMKSTESRSTSSCAACKFLKRRCVSTCIFSPYFRSDDPRKFAGVHKVFGASNVSKILVEVPESQRQDAVNSLAYEADARLRDPVYGCIGAIATLQKKMLQLQHDLAVARSRIARFNSPSFVNVDDVMASLGGDYGDQVQIPAVCGGNGGFAASQGSPENLGQRGSMGVGYGTGQSAPYIV